MKKRDQRRMQSGECRVPSVGGISNAGTQGGTTVGPAVSQSVASGCRTHVASRLSSGTTCCVPQGLKTNRRAFLKASGAGGLSLILSAQHAPAITKKRSPNILFMHLDQHHWEAVSAFGCKHVNTPSIDRLAAEGTSFDLSYSANPVCCPARACWYTGRASSENGVVMNDKWPIDKEMPDMGQWFSARGYDSVYAGKWHVTGRAFTQSFRVLTAGSGIGEVTDGMVSRAAEGFLRSRGTDDKPFFLNVGFLQPHDCCYWVFEHRQNTPLTRLGPPPADLPPLPENHGFDPNEPAPLRALHSGRHHRSKWTDEHWRWYLWNYYRMVEMADAEIGRVLNALDDTGLREETLVVLTADHGDGLGRHGLTSKMYLYDEAARVPFIASMPGCIKSGVRNTQNLISGLDVAPTFCDYAGIDSMPKARGLSLRKILEGRQADPWREFLVAETFRTGRMVRTSDYKYITYKNDPVSQLFDMRNDPGEMHNLATDPSKADILRKLAGNLESWEKDLEIFPLKEPPKKKPGKRKKG